MIRNLKSSRSSDRAFTLLEIILAMGIFAVAAIALTQAIQTISLSVVESISSAEIRERLRGIVLEESRRPDIEVISKATNPLDDGTYFQIDITEYEAENREGIELNDLYEITVVALRDESDRRPVELDRASTVVFSNLLSRQ